LNDPLDFSGVWKSSKSRLGEDEIAVNLDIEDAAASSDQPRRCTGDLLQLGRQPGSPRLVVSLTAVFDRDIHFSLPGR
jgi:hypothetical protein